MERSIRNFVEDSKNPTTGSIPGWCIWIQAQIHVLLTNDTKHVQLPFANGRSFTITVHTNRQLHMFLCRKKYACTPNKTWCTSYTKHCSSSESWTQQLKEITKDLTENDLMQNKEFQNDDENVSYIKKKTRSSKDIIK